MSEPLTGWAVVSDDPEAKTLEVEEVTLLGGLPAMGLFFDEKVAKEYLKKHEKMFPDDKPKTVVKVRFKRAVPKEYTPGKGLPWTRR